MKSGQYKCLQERWLGRFGLCLQILLCTLWRPLNIGFHLDSDFNKQNEPYRI